MRTIKSIKVNYQHAMHDIIVNRYGLESAFLNPRNPNYIGLEDLENELTANDEQVDESKAFADDSVGYDDTGMGEDMPDEMPVDDYGMSDGYSEADNIGPEDEFSNMSRDGQMGTDAEGNYTVDPGEISGGEWEDTNYDDLRSDADCINLTKVLGEYINNYALNFEMFIKNNKDFIDYSGDFKQTDHYNGFINPAMDILNKVFQDDPIIKHVESLIEIMSNKRTVLSVCGKPDNPFMYEGMQIVLVDTIRNLLACIPYSIKNNKTLSEVIDSMQLNVVKCLIQMVADLVEVSNLFGTKIYYVEPVVSEITGKSEEIANTPYTKLDVMSRGNESFTGMRLANESIMNLIEIKNNKALVEYTALTKMMLVITGLTQGINLKDSCGDVLRTVLQIASTNGEEVLPMIDSAIETFRTKVFVPEIQAMADLSAKESERLTENPEPNTELSQGTIEIQGGTSVEIPGEELEVEEEEKDFDNDLE